MPLLSFSVEDHKPKIMDGRKTQTMREPRKRPIKVGDKLYLWWKSRSKYEGEFLGMTVCTSVKRVTLGEVWDDEENAVKDGFNSLEEFRDFFSLKGWEYVKAYVEERIWPEEYDVICWKHPFTITNIDNILV